MVLAVVVDGEGEGGLFWCGTTILRRARSVRS